MENGWKWPIYRWFTVLKNGGSFHGKLLGHNQRLDLPYVSTFGSGDHGHHIVSLRFCWTSWPFGMIKNGGSPGRQTSRNHCLVVPYSYNVRPPVDSVQLVNITPITMVYGTQITIVTGAYINQLITGGPHIVSILHGIWSLAWCHVTKYFPEELLYIYIYTCQQHASYPNYPKHLLCLPMTSTLRVKIRGTSMTSPISKIPKRAQLAKPWMFRYPLVSFNMATWKIPNACWMGRCGINRQSNWMADVG